MLISTLSREGIRQLAPAALATNPAKRVSDRYSFFPTKDIIQALREEGWACVEARTAGSRRKNPIPVKYRKHELAFAEIDVLKRKSQLSEIPRILISNSHDGNSAAHMYAGLWRFICSNGMKISDGVVQSVRIPHTHQTIEHVLAAAQAFRLNTELIGQHVDAFKARQLSHAEVIEFGRRAIGLRQDPKAEGVVAIDDILRVKRNEDAGDSLWKVFNRAQEWLLKGEYPIYTWTEQGWTEHNARPIRGIDQNTSLNMGLWDLAEQFSLN
jgi:uncharacterized protein DUF932